MLVNRLNGKSRLKFTRKKLTGKYEPRKADMDRDTEDRVEEI
jgi:hypothetical protein